MENENSTEVTEFILAGLTQSQNIQLLVFALVLIFYLIILPGNFLIILMSSPSYLVRNPTLVPQLGKTHRHREIGDFFSCLTCATPWTAAHQASQSFTISQSLLKLMSIELVMPSSYPLSPPSPLALNLFPH